MRKSFFETLGMITALGLAVALESCAEDCPCDIDSSEFNHTTDTDSDNPGTETDGNAAATRGSFCNPLTLGSDPVVMTLLLGTGAAQVSLSAITGTCSNHLGEACVEIPTGTAVPLTVQTDGGQTVYTGELDIAPGGDYVFFTSVDSTASVILMSGLLTEALDCANMECIRSAYNERTCDVTDPCGWAGNGICDDYCRDRLLDGQTMFDDSADCMNTAR